LALVSYVFHSSTHSLIRSMFIKTEPWGWWDGSVGKSTRLLFRRSRVQIPATTWWLITIRNKIWRPLLECLKTATVYLHIIINKSLKKKKKKKNWTLQLDNRHKLYALVSTILCDKSWIRQLRYGRNTGTDLYLVIPGLRWF
jgi:hypothetical protein